MAKKRKSRARIYVVLNESGNSVRRVYRDGRAMQRYVDYEFKKTGIRLSWSRYEVTA